MFRERLTRIFERMDEAGEASNPFELLLVFAAASLERPKDKDYIAMFKNPEMAELRDLLALAFGFTRSKSKVIKGSKSKVDEAGAAIFALHKSVAAEFSQNRAGAISASRRLLKLISKLEFPQTWANAHLKLATALAVSSGGSRETLPEIVHSLQECLSVFSEKRDADRCCMAHYNLAIALSSSNWADWDDGEDRAGNALIHGRKALALMDKGMKGGDRAILSEVMIKILVLRNQGDRKVGPVREAISIASRLKKSEDFELLLGRDRKRFEELLNRLRDTQRQLRTRR